MRCPDFLYQSKAFTLLEMLVVLVIISMVTLLLMQSLQYVLDLRVRFVQQLDDLQQGALRDYWFRSSTAALLPDFQPSPSITESRPSKVFKGTDTGFSGLTLSGLEAPAGVPTAFAWQLNDVNGQTQLEYHTEQGQVWPILSWTGSQGRFEYLDAKGKWHKLWPPALQLSLAQLFASDNAMNADAEKIPQLPQAIVLHGFKHDKPFAWLVRIQGNKDDPFDVRTVFDSNNPL